MKIRVLPDKLVNQISAGEVVERPVSVVRELVDNSLDAQADDVMVAIESGGKSLIRVSDNGCGMSKDDALLAFERHATSKLSGLDDLRNIVTLGFRGEALPSIASVARVRMRTRAEESELATELEIEGGKIRSVRETPGSRGTEIEVSRLFFNTPVRRKFMKSDKIEEQRIKSWLLNYSIARPYARLRLFCDGRESLNLAPRPSSGERAAELFRGNTIAFSGRRGEIAVEGLVGHPSLAQADSAGFVIFVNGRIVSDRMLIRAIKEGFSSTLKEREFPIGYLGVSIPPSGVDVNVHPQKAEVRFVQPQELFALVRDSVAQAVLSFRVPFRYQAPERPALTFRDRAAFGDSGAMRSTAEQRPAPQQERLISGPGALLGLSTERPQRAAPASEGATESGASFRFSDLRYVGQVLECYLVCESGGELVVVDMHAAHERCNYNRIREALRGRALPVQRLLVPLEVEISAAGMSTLQAQSELFERLGFGLDLSAPDRVRVVALPAIFERSARDLIREAAAYQQEGGASPALEEGLDRIAARLACHASVRSGDLLTREEAYALFEDLDRAELAAACPHGRPVIVSFTGREVEEWFGRDR